MAYSFCKKANHRCSSYSFGLCTSRSACGHEQTIFDTTTACSMMVILAHMAKIMHAQDEIKQRLDQLEHQKKHDHTR